jgi:hypothetical protein
MSELLQLKGGYTTTDRRLDRVPQWDSKNENYNEREILEAFAVPQAGPRSYGWRLLYWLDQGDEGACVGFSWTHELGAWPAPVVVTDEFARGVYHEAQQLDEWPGEAYEGTSVLGGAKAVHGRGYMEEYRWATSMDDLVLAVGYHGPAVIGVNWLDSMFNPRPSGLVDTSGNVAGGHAILIVGVSLHPRLQNERLTEPVFRLRNSWGRSWGHNGDCYVKVSDMPKLFDSGNIEACIPVVRDRQPVPTV